MDLGVMEIEEIKILELDEFKEFGSAIKIVKEFGGRAAFLEAINGLKNEIYAA